MAGESGEAVVELTVDDREKTVNVALVSASEPEYGAALLAAVETWAFSAGMTEGARVPVKLKITHPFTPPVGGAVGRLVATLQQDAAGIGSAKGLDRPVNPVWRVSPTYPSGLRTERPVGEAKIEFIIDQAGRARLPKIGSASHEAFGWAAATAISQWVFDPPMREGKPVDVRASITMGFTPPKE